MLSKLSPNILLFLQSGGKLDVNLMHTSDRRCSASQIGDARDWLMQQQNMELASRFLWFHIKVLIQSWLVKIRTLRLRFFAAEVLRGDVIIYEMQKILWETSRNTFNSPNWVEGVAFSEMQNLNNFQLFYSIHSRPTFYFKQPIKIYNHIVCIGIMALFAPKLLKQCKQCERCKQWKQCKQLS